MKEQNAWVAVAVVVIVAIVAGYFGMINRGDTLLAPPSLESGDVCPDPTTSTKVCKGDTVCECLVDGQKLPVYITTDDGTCWNSKGITCTPKIVPNLKIACLAAENSDSQQGGMGNSVGDCLSTSLCTDMGVIRDGPHKDYSTSCCTYIDTRVCEPKRSNFDATFEGE
ncbi:hypothetical protein J4423_04985 [Candidatus Pacearchaeota archaeon]|nr:hypothetical protein [Candidatus Pacearchaeota archaeon]